MERLTTKALTERMPTDRRGYIAAASALAKSEARPSAMIGAFRRVFSDHQAGTLRPPLPSVVASSVEELLDNHERNTFDVVRNTSHKDVAQLLLAQIIDNSNNRYDTDPSFTEQRSSLSEGSVAQVIAPDLTPERAG